MKTIYWMVLCFLLNISVLSAQTMIVQGKVSDAATGELLPGVTVAIKKTNVVTMTNVDGRYTIFAKKGDLLTFSYLGYKSKDIIVSQASQNVGLEQDTQVLDEVVVTGSESSMKKMLTGSVSRIFSKKQSESQYVECEMAAPPAANKYYDQTQNEEYGSFVENSFKSASNDPLSTFSIDVDAASYSNMRRFVNQGIMPEKDALRTEELVNYFSYNYEKPTGKDPVKITTEVGECPWNKEHRLVRIGLKAREIASENLPASNLVFLIDVSGSMEGPTRLDLVKSSLKLLVNNLRNKDRVAIVVYAGSAGEVLPSTSGCNKQKIRESLDGLMAGGSTAGGAGIKLAYNIAKKNFITGGNNRVILCTDGDFNVGVSSAEGLESLIEKERKSGVFLTVLGYGMGNYKDKKMQVLAEKGNGNHAYIDNLQEANKVLVSEFGGTIYTVAKDVKLQIEFNPAKVQSYRLIGYESRLLNKEDFNDDTKDAGEIGAGHTVTALYEVVPTGVNGTVRGGVDPLKYQTVKQPETKISYSYFPDLLTVKLRYKLPNENQSSKIEVPLIDKGGNNVSNDFRFAASVAMFGQLLRCSDFKGNATYDKVIAMARTGLENDDSGYRREFVRLAETVKGLSK